MEFENKNLIIISGDKQIQIDSIDELSEIIFGREIKDKEDEKEVKEVILSMCKSNILKILEKKEANIFASGIDKSNMGGNYIIVNSYIDEIMNNNQ